MPLAMKVHLASTGLRPDHSHIAQFERLAACDRVGRHHLTDDPSAAEALLFVECHQLPGDWRLSSVLTSPLAERFPEKVYVYDERDRPWCARPGLYVSMPASSFREEWQASVPYFLLEDPARRLNREEVPGEPDLLFSFVGSRTHPCRQEILQLEHPRALVEPVEGFLFHDDSSSDFGRRRARFAESLFRSKFVLCPRGHGTSSIRLYESLAAGRAPVIISDDWQRPRGPDWEQIAVFCPENRIRDLPRYLESIEDEATERGNRAREAYEEWYGVDVMFDRLMNELHRLVVRRGCRPFPHRGLWDRRFVGLAGSEVIGRLRGAQMRARRNLGRKG